MPQSQNLERGTHGGYLVQIFHIERGDAHAPLRLADRQPLRLQLPEGFAHGHMACPEFGGDVVLTQSENGGEKLGHGSGGMELLRAA